MKYNRYPTQKPLINQLVWWLDPQCKERLGYYTGLSHNFPLFIGQDKKISTFHPKYWRNSNIEDELLIDWNPVDIQKPKLKKK